MTRRLVDHLSPLYNIEYNIWQTKMAYEYLSVLDFVLTGYERTSHGPVGLATVSPGRISRSRALDGEALSGREILSTEVKSSK
jgi:hypothetical protein